MPDATLNGHTHHWEEAGSGQPLIMIHGAASSSRSLLAHQPALAQHLRVLMVDLRGMGRSAHVSAMPRDWAADVIALLDHLGLDSTHLYGSSLGARIALRTAIDHAARVRSLILDHPIVAVEGETGERLGPPFAACLRVGPGHRRRLALDSAQHRRARDERRA